MTKFRRTLVAVVAIAALGVAFAACGSDSKSGDTESGGGKLTVANAWARSSPMLAKAGAAYVDIENESDTDDALVSASVADTIAMKTELHETISEGGAMKMQMVEKIVVPKGKTVTLKPGGYHIMLMELKEPLQEGATVDVTLEFEKAGTKTVKAEVRT